MNAVEWLQEIPLRNENRECVIDTISGERLTFGKLYKESLRVAADLQQRGLQRQDRVAILLHNSASFVKLYFGCLYAGLVTVPINPILIPKEIAFILQHSGAKLLVASSETIALIDRSVIVETGIDILVLLDKRSLEKASDSLEKWDFTGLSDPHDFVPFEGMSSEDTMTIVYTSGTTARPSGVVHRIADLIDNARLFNHRLGIGPENRFYGILAMTYLGGYYNLLMLPYVAEASVVLTNTFDARSALTFWQPAKQYGVNTLWLVPTILSILLEIDRGQDGENFCREQIELALIGTAPLPIQLRRNFEKRYGIPLYENYGLSETLFISTNAPTLPVIEGSVGHILPGIQGTVLDEQGKALPYGKEGEIHVCTPHLMQGYYNPDKGEPESCSQDIWFPSGDIGMLSANGDLFITGRRKDLIIRGGINVSPAAIENVLYQHPAIVECAVVGVPHTLYGEDITAAVRLTSGYSFDEVQPELITLCKENLSALRQPSQIFEIEEFPHSSSGKIQKNKIRNLLAHKLGVAHLQVYNPPVPSDTYRSPKLSGRLRRIVPRPDQAVVEKLKTYSTSIISDCMNRLGIMDAAIHPLVRGRAFCGPALTVEEVEGGNLMSHVALEFLQPGDVLVIDAKGVITRSCWGGLQTFMAKERGAAGIVIYGAVRDYQDIVTYGIPVFALGVCPGGPLKGWTGNVNYPISCGGVVVQAGDIVVGDDDGVVVVPQDLAKRVVQLCEQRASMEQDWFQQVKQGKSTLDVVGLRDKLQELGVEVE